MVQPRFSPADELQRAAELLARQWQLALPTALASLIVVAAIFFGIFGAIGSAIAGSAAGSHTGVMLGVGTGLLVVALVIPIGLAVLALAQAVVVAASADAWAGRPFDFNRSLAAVTARLPDLLIALVVTSIGFAVFGLLSLLLIGVPLLIALGYFTMYVQPAILIGGESAMTAFATSFRLAQTFVGESVVAFIGIIAAGIAGNVVNAFLVHVPLVNLLAGFAIGGLTSAFAALVGARFYVLLRDQSPETGFMYAPPPPSA